MSHRLVSLRDRERVKERTPERVFELEKKRQKTCDRDSVG